MVYAVAMDTVRRFEVALGREVKWRPDYSSNQANPYHGVLKIYPHSMQEANAFYDPRLHAPLFGYFEASKQDDGLNPLPEWVKAYEYSGRHSTFGRSQVIKDIVEGAAPIPSEAMSRGVAAFLTELRTLVLVAIKQAGGSFANAA